MQTVNWVVFIRPSRARICAFEQLLNTDMNFDSKLYNKDRNNCKTNGVSHFPNIPFSSDSHLDIAFQEFVGRPYALNSWKRSKNAVHFF
jgi:hypothetical protein